MVIDRMWEVRFDELVSRPVRAGAMVVATQGVTPVVVVLDADSNEFVAVSGLPARLSPETVSLSSDGTRLVFLAPQDSGAGPMRVLLFTLETRALQAFASDEFLQAALSPDGKRLAVLSDHSDVGTAGITLIDISTGDRRLLWSAGGFWEEAAVGWSPDGELLAVTYLSADGILTTAVLDVAGRTIGVYPERAALPGPHSVWMNERELLVYPDPDDESPLIVIDVPTHGEHRFTRRNFNGYIAAHAGRVVRRGHAPGLYITSNLNDEDEREFLAFSPPAAIAALDITP